MSNNLDGQNTPDLKQQAGIKGAWANLKSRLTPTTKAEGAPQPTEQKPQATTSAPTFLQRMTSVISIKNDGAAKPGPDSNNDRKLIETDLQNFTKFLSFYRDERANDALNALTIEFAAATDLGLIKKACTRFPTDYCIPAFLAQLMIFKIAEDFKTFATEEEFADFEADKKKIADACIWYVDTDNQRSECRFPKNEDEVLGKKWVDRYQQTAPAYKVRALLEYIDANPQNVKPAVKEGLRQLYWKLLTKDELVELQELARQNLTTSEDAAEKERLTASIEARKKLIDSQQPLPDLAALASATKSGVIGQCLKNKTKMKVPAFKRQMEWFDHYELRFGSVEPFKNERPLPPAIRPSTPTGDQTPLNQLKTEWAALQDAWKIWSKLLEDYKPEERKVTEMVSLRSPSDWYTDFCEQDPSALPQKSGLSFTNFVNRAKDPLAQEEERYNKALKKYHKLFEDFKTYFIDQFQTLQQEYQTAFTKLSEQVNALDATKPPVSDLQGNVKALKPNECLHDATSPVSLCEGTRDLKKQLEKLRAQEAIYQTLDKQMKQEIKDRLAAEAAAQAEKERLAKEALKTTIQQLEARLQQANLVSPAEDELIGKIQIALDKWSWANYAFTMDALKNRQAELQTLCDEVEAVDLDKALQRTKLQLNNHLQYLNQLTDADEVQVAQAKTVVEDTMKLLTPNQVNEAEIKKFDIKKKFRALAMRSYEETRTNLKAAIETLKPNHKQFNDEFEWLEGTVEWEIESAQLVFRTKGLEGIADGERAYQKRLDTQFADAKKEQARRKNEEDLKQYRLKLQDLVEHVKPLPLQRDYFDPIEIPPVEPKSDPEQTVPGFEDLNEQLKPKPAPILAPETKLETLPLSTASWLTAAQLKQALDLAESTFKTEYDKLNAALQMEAIENRQALYDGHATHKAYAKYHKARAQLARYYERFESPWHQELLTLVHHLDTEILRLKKQYYRQPTDLTLDQMIQEPSGQYGDRRINLLLDLRRQLGEKQRELMKPDQMTNQDAKKPVLELLMQYTKPQKLEEFALSETRQDARLSLLRFLRSIIAWFKSRGFDEKKPENYKLGFFASKCAHNVQNIVLNSVNEIQLLRDL